MQRNHHLESGGPEQILFCALHYDAAMERWKFLKFGALPGMSKRLASITIDSKKTTI
ncbi:hypothetical protein [Sphingopyxis sp. 550A]